MRDRDDQAVSYLPKLVSQEPSLSLFLAGESMNPIEPITTDDRESLEQALESFRAYLLFVAWRIKGDQLAGREGASDFVQRTILAAVERIREGNIPGPTEKHRKAWLRKILFNTVNQTIRREHAEKRGGGRVLGGLDDPGPDSAISPSGEAIKNEESLLLDHAFGQLDPDEQQLINWRYVDGLTCEEIGRRRGCSASYVSRICNEAVGRLRRALT
jgi:RNA polymerase sigma factor (sigma-70 family)